MINPPRFFNIAVRKLAHASIRTQVRTGWGLCPLPAWVLALVLPFARLDRGRDREPRRCLHSKVKGSSQISVQLLLPSRKVEVLGLARERAQTRMVEETRNRTNKTKRQSGGSVRETVEKGEPAGLGVRHNSSNPITGLNNPAGKKRRRSLPTWGGVCQRGRGLQEAGLRAPDSKPGSGLGKPGGGRRRRRGRGPGASADPGCGGGLGERRPWECGCGGCSWGTGFGARPPASRFRGGLV